MGLWLTHRSALPQVPVGRTHDVQKKVAGARRPPATLFFNGLAEILAGVQGDEMLVVTTLDQQQD